MLTNNENYEPTAKTFETGADGDKVVEFLKKSAEARNTISLTEFKRFVPLFQKNGYEHYDEDGYRNLVLEFQERFSLHHPIHIVQGDAEVLTLPPIWRKIGTLNDVADSASDLMQAFSTASQRDDLGSRARTVGYEQGITKMLDALFANDSREKDVEQATKMADAAMARINGTDVQEPQEPEEPEVSKDEFEPF